MMFGEIGFSSEFPMIDSLCFKEIMDFQKWKMWKRHVLDNPDDPSNKFQKILNTGSIFSRKHEMEILPNILESWHLEILKLSNFQTFNL